MLLQEPTYLLTLLLVLNLSSAFLLNSGQKPNIIFIVADDLGFSDVGYRNGDIISPNIDKIAKEGVVLNSSYVQPSCSPSRTAIMTGRYPYKLGLQVPLTYNQRLCLSVNETLLPQRLQTLGYRTHAIGKWHLGFCNWECTPTRRGFDTFYGIYGGASHKFTHTGGGIDKKFVGYDFRDQEEAVRTGINSKYSTYLYGDKAVEIIEGHDTDHPMFMWLSFQNVHSPVQVPDKYVQMYPGIDNNQAKYYGMVTVMDEYIGKIISSLKKKKIYDNTLIIFTTDNGGKRIYGGNNWPLRGEKSTVFEGGTRGVTLIDSPLLKKRGYVNNGLFHAIDWTPTLLHFAEGAPQTDIYMDGIDQFDMLHTGADSKRSGFIYMNDERISVSAIRDGDYKLIWGKPIVFEDCYTGYFPQPAANNTEQRQRAKSPDVENGKNELRSSIIDHLGNETLQNNVVLLFNLKDDPTESNDLSKMYPKIVSSLKAKLTAAKLDYVEQDMMLDDKCNPANFGNFWSPGWC